MEEQNKMDEKLKWITQLVHNQELCAIVNSTSLQLRGLCQ
jgi:hypothetical protein